MSTKVIKQYLDEGVLNYIEHANPLHYFLYDGVMEEHNADVHRLVEDLCDENMELQKRVKELEHILASSPCEIAAHSNKLTEYMFHWEGRALDAEAKLTKDMDNTSDKPRHIPRRLPPVRRF